MLILKAFCSTPVETLTIQSGIMCFQAIRKKALMLNYVNMESLNEIPQDSFFNIYASMEGFMEHIGLYESEG